MNMARNTYSYENIDVNNANFHDQLQDEVESDLARLKKSVVIAKNLRITAAELEVETAALYHAELWHDIEDLKTLAVKMEVDSNTENSSTAEKPLN